MPRPTIREFTEGEMEARYGEDWNFDTTTYYVFLLEFVDDNDHPMPESGEWSINSQPAVSINIDPKGYADITVVT